MHSEYTAVVNNQEPRHTELLENRRVTPDKKKPPGWTCSPD